MTDPISTAALSQIESGRVRSTFPTLQDLAWALDVPVGFFSAEWSSASTEDLLHRVTYFRDLASTPAKERRRAAALTLLLTDLLSAIETHIRLPALDLPGFAVEAAVTAEEVDAIAQAVRGEWNIEEDQPVPHAIRALEQHGIPVARFDLGTSKVSAFSLRTVHRPLVVQASTGTNYVRSRFDALHELGHLVMHEGRDPGDRAIEKQANAFASSFLMPHEVALQVLPTRLDTLAWGRLAELKRDWGMSIQAMLFRSRDLGLLGPDRYRTAMKYLSGRGWRVLEPGDREMGPAEAPMLIATAFARVAAHVGLSPEDFLEDARLPIDDVLALIRSSGDTRPTLDL